MHPAALTFRPIAFDQLVVESHSDVRWESLNSDGGRDGSDDPRTPLPAGPRDQGSNSTARQPSPYLTGMASLEGGGARADRPTWQLEAIVVGSPKRPSPSLVTGRRRPGQPARSGA